MDLSEELGYQLSSPHSSSGGADSFKGTPDTRLTAFSPNENSTKSAKGLKTPGTSGPDTTPIRYSASSSHVSTHADPFVTHSPNRKSSQKLSPTATAFRPISASRQTSIQVPVPNVLIGPTSAAQLPVVSTSPSTQTGVSRTLLVSHRTHLIDLLEVEKWLSELEKSGLHFFDRWTSQGWGDQVILQFDDVRDSILALAHSRAQATWEVRYLTSGESRLVKDTNSHQNGDSDFQAQALVSAFTLTPSQSLDVVAAEGLIRQLLLSHADVYSFQKQSPTTSGIYKALVEFCAVSAAKSAAVKFANISLEGIHITIEPHQQAPLGGGFTSPMQTVMDRQQDAGRGRGHPESPLIATMQGLTISKPGVDVPGSSQREESPSQGPLVGYQVHSPIAMYPIIYHPHLAPGMQYVLGHGPLSSSQGSGVSLPHSVAGFSHALHPGHPHETLLHGRGPGYGRPDGRRLNAYRTSRGPYYAAASHHNHVDVNRIRDGIDVRTTIMLRNIPNKVDQAMLKRIVDESSWGKYDFMYLRIDFANDCNVGYAFINFVDPLDIIDFVTARGNQRWNCFKSDKVAEISYATIQGKDCLVQKFRNSSVMLEAAHYRPKLYFTLNGPRPDLAGQEEPFPEPDNQSKMKRSCENAEHVGLFTPNAGQHFRDEQRRRRSQYDRGTRLAALEEYNYDTAIDQVFGQH